MTNRDISRVVAMLSVLLTAPLQVVAAEPEGMDNPLESLLHADKTWSETVDDMDAFAQFLDPNVYLLAPNQARIQGADAFRATFEQLLASVSLSWTADTAAVSDDGSFGYTLGTFELTVDSEEGVVVVGAGKFATNWRRDDQGEWKVVVDTFNFDAPPPAPEDEEADAE